MLSTVHSAKGLEWDAVHVIAVYDGNFPADMATGSREGIAEERRLLYVALTRARRQLVVYVPARYHHRPGGIDDAYGLSKPSRFLTDRGSRDCSRVTRTREPAIAVRRGASGRGPRRIEVSVDALFRLTRPCRRPPPIGLWSVGRDLRSCWAMADEEFAEAGTDRRRRPARRRRTPADPPDPARQPAVRGAVGPAGRVRRRGRAVAGRGRSGSCARRRASRCRGCALLGVYDTPGRDPRGWSVSVVFVLGRRVRARGASAGTTPETPGGLRATSCPSWPSTTSLIVGDALRATAD